MTIPVKASIWFIISGFLKNVIDILATPFFTRILTKEQYGVFSVYYSWYLIVNIVFSLYLFGDVFNVGLVKYEKDIDRFISSSLGFVTSLVVFFLTGYLIFYNTINNIVGLPWFLVILLFPHVLMTVPYQFWIRRQRFDYHYRSVVLVSTLYIFFQPIMSAIAILWLNLPLNPGYTRVIATVNVQIVIGLLIYVYLMFRGRTFYVRKYWKYSLKVGIELVPFNLSRILLNQADKIMINYFSGSGDTAIYSIAHSAAFVLQAVTDALNAALVPWLYRKMKIREWIGIKNVINGLIILVTVCVFGIDMIAPEIMKILGNKEYYEGVYCIPSLVYSVYLIFICSVFTNIEFFYEKNNYVTIISSLGMIVNIILNAVFIPIYGYLAAGYTTLVGFLVMCFGHFILMKKCLTVQSVKVSNLFDMKTIIAVSTILFGFTISCCLLYQFNVIRWIFLFGLVVIMIVTKDKWLNLITNLKKGNNNEVAAKTIVE